jgi:translation initiation factor IF-2
MTENNSQNDKQKQKLSLGIGQNKLGLSKASTSPGQTLSLNKDKLQLTTPFAQHPNVVNKSKGKVIVVTKNRPSKEFHKKGSSQRGDDGLTDQEKKLRLQALSQLSEQKRVEEELKSKAIEESELTSKQEETPATAEEQPNVIKENTDEMEAIQEQAAVKRNEEILKIISSQGKLRNLDHFGREEAKKTAQEEVLSPSGATALEVKPEKEVVKPVEKKKPLKTQLLEEEKEKTAIRKPREELKRGTSRKLSVTQIRLMDDEEDIMGGRVRSIASIRRAKDKARRKQDKRETEKIAREVLLPDCITVQELASRMSEKSADVVKALMNLGLMVTINQTVDADTAELVINEFGHKVKRITEVELENALLNEVEDEISALMPRAPVVTIMGHVDHGKTSLLDALRSTDVVSGEAGGITQKIGAYKVTLNDGRFITFVDTPGHEAFTAMRSRGTKVTDIVVLVVAADDGIMAQTVEAINHAKAAGVPIIVAINKIDKPNADPTRVRNELLQHGLVAEEMGGDIMVVEVSAKQKTNLDKLEEGILLQAEMLELKANPDRRAVGVVIESQVDKGRGPTASLLVQKGSLRVGDVIVAGTSCGRIRALIDDKGNKLKVAIPSIPVEVLGLDQAPVSGDEFRAVPNDKVARELTALRTNIEKQKQLTMRKPASLESLFKRASSQHKILTLILKADLHGSIEAITSSLQKLANEEIEINIIHSGIGGITNSDVTLAQASNAIIIGFNVRANPQAREQAKKNYVDIRYYSIIYSLVDEIKAAMSGMLSPLVKETYLGYAEVREVFNLSKFGKIAGCYVMEGLIRRNSKVRLLRDDIVIYEGNIKALKRFKEDVKEVKQSFECGISFDNYEDVKVSDKIEAFEVTEEARKID